MNSRRRSSRSSHHRLGTALVLAALASCSAGRHYDVTHDQIVTMLREAKRNDAKMVFLGATSTRAYYSVSSPSWFSDIANEDIYSVALNGLPDANRRALPLPQRTGLPSLTDEFYLDR